MDARHERRLRVMMTRGRSREACVRRELADRRSGQVVFLSHCLLNQNTRYLGGATCPGVVLDAIKPYVDGGVGIVQMACPEQRVWGGVLKRRFLWLIAHPYVARASHSLLALGRPYLRFRYRRLARAVARDIEDYVGSGLDVVGVVGVAASPSCGAGTTLDLAASLRALGLVPARRHHQGLDEPGGCGRRDAPGTRPLPRGPDRRALASRSRRADNRVHAAGGGRRPVARRLVDRAGPSMR
jgi:predicted secreted protein